MKYNWYKTSSFLNKSKIKSFGLTFESFDLTAFSYTTKYIKEKGEIVDEYQIVKAKKVFNNEKEPESRIDVKYEEE